MPDPPEAVKCVSVGEDTANIVWEPPKFDGVHLLKVPPLPAPSTNFFHGSMYMKAKAALFDPPRLSNGEEEERILEMDKA